MVALGVGGDSRIVLLPKKLEESSGLVVEAIVICFSSLCGSFCVLFFSSNTYSKLNSIQQDIHTPKKEKTKNVSIIKELGVMEEYELICLRSLSVNEFDERSTSTETTPLIWCCWCCFYVSSALSSRHLRA